MWTVDENGNVVWVEGATRADVAGGPRQWGIIRPETPLGQQILQSRAAGGGGFFAPLPDEVAAARDERAVPADTAGTGRNFYRGGGIDTTRTFTAGGDAGGLDLTGLFGPDAPMAPDGGGVVGGPGYTPSLVDTAAAEALLRYEQTPEERAALEQLLQDLEFRAEAGTAAVRTGWQDVQAINGAAAEKAARMARAAGPEAARLWVDAANTVLNLSAQAAEVLGTTPGMQRVNISPSAGSERIAALLAAQAPRAQALAERMGLASAEEIAAQARTAGMMGEAYAGDIQRTALIQANQARQAHNQQVLARISQERQLGAQMRFDAARTNAQLLSQAAAQAASGATGETARERVLQFVGDLERVATFSDPAQGAALLAGAYNIDPATLTALITSARQGMLDYQAALAAIKVP